MRPFLRFPYCLEGHNHIRLANNLGTKICRIDFDLAINQPDNNSTRKFEAGQLHAAVKTPQRAAITRLDKPFRDSREVHNPLVVPGICPLLILDSWAAATKHAYKGISGVPHILARADQLMSSSDVTKHAHELPKHLVASVVPAITLGKIVV
ncbi:hypothetical protein HG530_008352 [Fusarium avenaceum]|nr:hypothetical protein HG530_008352 [Fusarium avenaceum]